jgi:hypothetical protein
MKTQQYLAGVLLIALLVAGAILTTGARLSSLLYPLPQGEAKTGQLPSAGNFTIDYAVSGQVELAWTGAGILTDNLTAPTPEELETLPDLGAIELAFVLQKAGGTNVTGFVELEESIVYTGFHTINTTIVGEATTMVVGPQISGSYANGILNLLSERVAYVTESGEAVERQFRLVGSAGQTPGVLVGEYRETVWGYGLEPITVVGTFTLVDIAITAATVNRPPVVDSLALSTPRDTAVATTLVGGDLEGKPITYAIVSQPSSGKLSGSAPNLTYTPNAGFTGTDTFTFKVNDGELDSETESVTIKVTAPPGENNAPTATAQTVNAVTAQAKSMTLTGSDADGNALTFTVVTQPANGTLSGTAPNLNYTSNAGFVGTDSFTFKVNDGQVDSPAVTVTINVTKEPPVDPPNNAPTANADTVTTQQGGNIAITLGGVDPDGDTVTFIIVTQPTNGTLTGTAPNLTYTPNPGFVGTDSFTYKVNDGTTDSATVTVTIVVEAGTPVDEDSKIFLPVTRK